MPTVASKGQLQFVVNTREQPFEAPHVHVRVGGEDSCRIELDGGTFLDPPPPGKRRAILLAYLEFAEEIKRVWEEIHGD